MDISPDSIKTQIRPSTITSSIDMSAVVAQSSPAKPIRISKIKKIWIGLGVSIVLIGGLTATILISKNYADTTATKYMTSLKSYLGQVYNTTSSATASPASIKDSLSKLNKPTLNNMLISSISSKYTDAQALAKSSNSKLDTFNSQIASLIAVNDYHTAYTQLSTKSTTGSGIKGLNATLSLLKQVKVLTDKTKAPDELKTDFSNVSSDYGDMITALTAIIKAYNTGDETTLTSSYDSYMTAINKTSTAQVSINTYYNNLSSKFISSANYIKTYSNSIK